MRKREAERLRKQWLPLVIHIINTNFSWALMSTGNGAYEKIRRAVDRDDLKQVGFIALMEAAKHYDPKHWTKSQFKTYAYRVIYNSLLNYLDDNCTPITTSRRRQILREGSDLSKSQLEAATGYICFSELSDRNSTSPTDEIEYVPTPSREETATMDPSIVLADYEFTEHCITKLRNGLTDEEWRVLMLRYEGHTFKEIGELTGMSYEPVRGILESLNYKIRHILFEEIEEFGCGNNTHKSLAHQTNTTRKRGPRPRLRVRAKCDQSGPECVVREGSERSDSPDTA